MKEEKRHSESRDVPPNPIDPDKVAERPGTLDYAHHVGSALIKPIDRGRVKGVALQSMYEQTNRQLDQIREQVALLARQAQAIHRRVRLSERIYQAQIPFEPLPGHVYHLYRRPSGEDVLSMVAPDEWGRSCPLQFVATVRLLADHTWEVLAGSLAEEE